MWACGALTADIKTNIMSVEPRKQTRMSPMPMKPVKPVVWLADSQEQLAAFAPDARRVAGFELWEVQQGKEPSDWKPMPTVGLGVNEIRVRVGAAYRVLCIAKFAEAVYVLHAFQKKSRKTPKLDIELARTRFRTLIQDRKQR